MDEERLREHLAATRSQLRAAMGTLKTTNQLIAQSLELLDEASTARRHSENGRNATHARDRVG